MSPWQVACRSVELEEGRPKRVILQDQMVLLLRQGEALYASHALCPHKYGSLVDGTFGDACVTCPVHDATFDLRSGEPGPDEAWAGRLQVFPVRSRDGQVEVRMDDAPPP